MNSLDDFVNRNLIFVTDANGVVHLNYDPVSKAWILKNKGTLPATLALSIGYSETFVYDCTAYALTGLEINNLTLTDVEGGI